MKRRGSQARRESWQTHLKWLRPGLGVKRWLFLLVLGIGLLGLGGALALRLFFPLPRHLYYLTLQFLPPGIRAGAVVGLGLWAIAYSLWGLNRAILAPFTTGATQPIAEVIYDYRRRGRGPRIVVIGGGHGQATVLRGLKAFTSNLTAIVTVADDGGSSGRLRRDIGILPPGDFRNCIAALADDESLVTRLFGYRYADGRDLSGHSFGNLFITAMAGITGSFESALMESSRVLAVQGQVLPSTLEAVILCADIARDGQAPLRVCGESEIPKVSGHVLRVALDPITPSAYPGAIQAILAAELIVIGPGSLYTSILPNLLVPGIAEALRASPAPKAYVCNVATQPGETDNYTAQAHLEALEQHVGEGVIDVVVVNTKTLPKLAVPEHIRWVKPDVVAQGDQRVIHADLVSASLAGHHDSHKLAQELLALIE
ncbi:MAG: YvcK family protein [Anaerolineae bacterium]|nr:YvcK family protein [Anaerolineae bacterium]